MKFIKNIIILAVCCVYLTANASVQDKKSIDKVRKSIVTITSRVPVSAYSSTGSWTGTGFIVDSKNGFLITNNHVVGRACTGTYFVTFHNGQQAEAKLAYYDQYVDVAILKIDPKDLPVEFEVVEFTSKKPELGTEVFIVGNSEGQGFSFHSGYLSELFNINGEMPQGSYVINMNSAGGSSGSPILNKDNKAVGVLYGGGKSYAIALKGDYVQYILKYLQDGKDPKRKHIGVITELYSLDKATKHRSFPKGKMDSYIKEFPNARNRVITVGSLIPGSPAEGKLKAGDILWKINGKKINADLALLDLEMSASDSASANITVIRNGSEIDIEIALYDINGYKVKKMWDFAGGIFFESDDFVAAKYGIPLGRVALTNVQNGSSFSSIPQAFYQNNKSNYRVLVKALNKKLVRSLDDMRNISLNAIKSKYVHLEYKNYQPYYPDFQLLNGAFLSVQEDLMQDIMFDSIDTKPRMLKYNPTKFEWEVEEQDATPAPTTPIKNEQQNTEVKN